MIKRLALLFTLAVALSAPLSATTTWVEVQCPVFPGIAGFFAPGYTGNTLVLLATEDGARGAEVVATLPDGSVVTETVRFDAHGQAIAWFVAGAHVAGVAERR